ncbi:hypothetical protein [Archangium lansingense]|uniref:SAM-dependent methyltransferase n=1 Tax=Archangium lansingense TaxID=2995310 RepID=A0ABT4ANJ9_9BACT|nr:hypothetical protein [Archangium lansinium]MCY1082744.1 hypothetical protein [Archangium lansinium]
MSRTFEELVAEAESVSVDGWDFSWLNGRASEQRPSWGYQRMMGERLARAAAALDIQTGGGEVLAGVPKLPPLVWMVPGFTVSQYRAELKALHEHIQVNGPFVAHTTRFLIEARKNG